MKRKLAIFQTPGGSEMVGDESWVTYNEGEYVRQTEYLDLDFPERDKAEVVPEQVGVLKNVKYKLREQFLIKEAELDERISKLLAITHEVTE